METTLNLQQKRFCEEYLTDLNATQAAIRAGYSSSTAESGYLLTLPAVQDYLSERQREKIDRCTISLDLVLVELANLAFCNIEDCFYSNGEMKPLECMETPTRAAIASVDVKRKYALFDPKQKTAEQIKIKMHNKLRALDLLAKHLTVREAREKVEAEQQEREDKMAMYATDEYWEEYDRRTDPPEEAAVAAFEEAAAAVAAAGFEEVEKAVAVVGFEESLSNFQNSADTQEYPSEDCLNLNLSNFEDSQNFNCTEESPSGGCLNQNLSGFQNSADTQEYPSPQANYVSDLGHPPSDLKHAMVCS